MTRHHDIFHIPMIDFRAKVFSGGYAEVKERLLSVIGTAKSGKVFPGYLLISGESFHYIGLEVMTLDEFLEFLGLCLLCENGADPSRPSPVDRRWIGRSLTRQSGSLRIFAQGSKPEPYVIEKF